ncbi:MAG: Ig-like domain-containing protein [Brevefilum sp.]
MKRKIISIMILALLLLGLIATETAYADPVVTEGDHPSADIKAAVRFKSFGNSGSKEIYLGGSDIGADRSESDVTWKSPSDNPIVFSYVPDDGKLTAKVTTPSQTYTLDYDIGDIGAINYLQIDVVNREDETTVNLNNLTVGSESLGSFVGDGWRTWHVTGLDLSEGFTILGEIELGGTQPASDELNKIQISVGFVNKKPVAFSQTVEAQQNRPVFITLTGNDEDGDTLIFDVREVPKHGDLSGITPHLIYAPKPHFVGTDSFQFTVSDGELTSDPATVTIIVDAVQYIPLFLN